MPGMHGWLSIRKYISIIHLLIDLKRSYAYPTDAGKAFDKFSIIQILEKIELEEYFFLTL